jgi:hypothetical protein
VRTNWFIVIQANGAWWVDNEGHGFGPFPSRGVAAIEAVNYARTLGDPSRQALIYWPDDTGKMTLIRQLRHGVAEDPGAPGREAGPILPGEEP